MKISGVSKKFKEELIFLIESNKTKEAFLLLQKLVYQEGVIDEVSAQLGRLREIQTSMTISEEQRIIESNKLRYAIYSLLEEYEDDFPHLSCSYTYAIKNSEQRVFVKPTDETPILICFLIDLSYSMFGKAQSIELLLNNMELSFEKLSQKIDLLASKNTTSAMVSTRVRVSILGMGMTPIEDKLLSFFGDGSHEDIPPVQSLLGKDSVLLSEILNNWKAIKSHILSSSKGGNYSHIREAWQYAQGVILNQNLLGESLKVLFTISDGEWEEDNDLFKLKKQLEADNVLIVNGLLLEQNQLPYKYFPTLGSIDSEELNKIVSLSSDLPNNTEIYRTLNELKWEFEPTQSKLCLQLNEYSTINEVIEILIRAIK